MEQNIEIKTKSSKMQQDKTEGSTSKDWQLRQNMQQNSKDMKTVYQITKKLKGDFGQQSELPVKAVDGRTLSNEDEKLNGKNTFNRYSIAQTHQNLQISQRLQTI